MKCLKRDCDEGMSFNTHFLIIGQTCICWGLNFLFMLNLLFVLNLLLFFFLLIVIRNFFTLQYGGVKGMLMTRMTLATNHVVPLSH
jgi:hypothetical protein